MNIETETSALIESALQMLKDQPLTEQELQWINEGIKEVVEE